MRHTGFMPCSLEHEETLWASGLIQVAGIDEAGRGPLAGSVVAAAVVLPKGFSLLGLDDSKKLTHRKRLKLKGLIEKTPGVHWGVGRAEAEEIDRINILRATHEAMRRAVAALPFVPDHVLIDGLQVTPFPVPQTALVGGDGLSLSIAAASVIAKVTRDLEMEAMDREYPQYGFAAHKGYGTALHLERLKHYGPCPHHRQSFAPVAKCARKTSC